MPNAWVTSYPPYPSDWINVTFEKKLTIAVLFGTLPLLGATILSGLLISQARRGGGVDAIALTMLCLFTYAIACLVLIPSIGVVMDRTYRRKLALERRERILTGVAAAALVLPPILVDGLHLLLLA
jgi:ABC-type amino acid transport system permease subunit